MEFKSATNRGLLFCLLFFVFTCQVWAEDNLGETSEFGDMLDMSIEDLMGMEVELATGSFKPLNLAPAVASVITAEQIERIGATTLDEALEVVPGLHVIPSSFSRLDSSYSIRGIIAPRNPQVLLLIDGIPLTYIQNGSRPSCFNMSTSNVSRIEVVRGPGSAVHGADAFAGTINIITKVASEIDGTIFGMRAGSFGTTDSWGQYGGQHGGWDIGFGVDYLRSDGDTDRIVESDLQTTLDGAFGTSASHAPGALETDDRILNAHFNLSKENWTIRLWGLSNKDAGNGAGVAQALDPEGRDTRDNFIIDLDYHNDTLSKDWDLDLRLNYEYMKGDAYMIVFPDGSTLPIGADGSIDFVTPAGVTFFPDGVIGNPVSKDDIYAIDLTTFYKGFDSHILRFATGYKYADEETSESKNFGSEVLDGSQSIQDGTQTDVTGTPDIFLGNHSRGIWHASFQDEWAFMKNWELTGGVRYDHYSDFGFTVNPRLALVWETRYDLTTKLLYGSAFRPPSFGELYISSNPASLGNEDLEPETIDTYELAFEYQPTKNLLTRLNLFAYEIDGLIEAVPDTGQTTKTYQNYKDQEGRGFELEAEWQTAQTLRLSSNFAYQRSKDKDTGEITPDTPELQFHANAYWNFLPEWSLNSQYYWIGKRHRAAGDTRKDIKDNDIVNLTLRRKNIFKHLDMAFAVRNLFDEDVREPGPTAIPNDYPMESRAIWGELRYTF